MHYLLEDDDDHSLTHPPNPIHLSFFVHLQIAASEGYERETSGTVEAADFEVL